MIARKSAYVLAIAIGSAMQSQGFALIHKDEGFILFTRYAVFFTFGDGPLGAFCNAWLGWDVARGVTVEHPKMAGINVSEITDIPRKYGVHGTIKPPFVLADGKTQADLTSAFQVLCRGATSVEVGGLELTTLGRFLALCPVGKTRSLNALAAQVVQDLDGLRAPPSENDLAHRRDAKLTPAQDENLRRWGYPYVMDAYKFHITLTGRLDKQTLIKVKAILTPLMTPLLSKPFIIGSLTLVGQREDGMFEQIQRYPLAP